MFIVDNGAERVECAASDLFTHTERLAPSGPLTIIERLDDGSERTILRAGKAPGAPLALAPVAEPAPIVAASAPVYSDFGQGQQVIDAGAKSRIEGLHAKLQAGGVKVNASEQLFATGTRMAQGGYSTQAEVGACWRSPGANGRARQGTLSSVLRRTPRHGSPCQK